MKDIVRVGLGARAYDIHIGSGLLAQIGSFLQPYLARNRVFIITDNHVAALHLPDLQAGLTTAGIASEHLILPAGEGTKSWFMLEKTTEWLIAQKVERDDLIIAFGGGVIGDLVGFSAAILRRGVPYVQIPTSLLAQVDSSVGGKTAINSAQGKNLIGVFYQPKLVLCDCDLLETLPQRDFIAGYAEVLKYALLGDGAFFDWLGEYSTALREGNQAARIKAITRSCQMKAMIVAADEREQDQRALLNLGHTFGHALEAATGYSNRLLHGEAVAIGCVLAFETAQALGLCSQEAPSRLREHLRAMGAKVDLNDIEGDLPDADTLIALMYQDKKVKDGKLTFIMVRDIGDAFVTRNVDLDVVRKVLISNNKK